MVTLILQHSGVANFLALKHIMQVYTWWKGWESDGRSTGTWADYSGDKIECFKSCKTMSGLFGSSQGDDTGDLMKMHSFSRKWLLRSLPSPFKS